MAFQPNVFVRTLALLEAFLTPPSTAVKGNSKRRNQTKTIES
jgi:hypothetical protein